MCAGDDTELSTQYILKKKKERTYVVYSGGDEDVALRVD